ncbi:immunity 49 family protein [Streptomyces sp. NPDC102406]|uniref:immunity 49 family protein n=1 Tax=Streptomyces sp. NPDC102406 TaxID=3366171 RepID=UPI00382463FF
MLSRNVTWALEDLDVSPAAIGDALSSALTRAETRLLADPPAGLFETWDAWVTAMQAGSALLEAALIDEGSIRVRIEHEVRSIPASGPQSSADAGNWITAFWLAVVCREKNRVTRLCQVPTALLRASGAEYDDYIYTWIDALQAYWQEREDFGHLLVTAAQGTRPDELRITSPDLMSLVLWSPIELMTHLVRGDEPQFNESLASALQRHKQYWSADSERARRSTGLVALGPLAIACFAHDAGFPISVESEYLPKALLTGAWAGEFET